jgi:protein O-mannosyl-transferase
MGSRTHRQKFKRSPLPQNPSPPKTLLWLGRPRPRLYLSLLLIGLTVAVYAQVGRFEIVDFDDADYVGDNLYVNQGLTRNSIAWAFSGFHYANWIPLTWLSLMLDATLFGRWPGGNHVTNLILHAANVLLVFATFARATGNAPRSAFVAALFAIHPLHVESVAWISERKDVLSMLLGLSALYFYVRAASGRRVMWLALAWVAFAGSLMAKQTFVTLPFLFLLLDYWPLGRLAGEPAVADAGGEQVGAASEGVPRGRLGPLILEKLPFLLITAVFCVVAVLAQHSAGAIPTWIPLTTRCLNAVLVYGLYLWRAVVPVGLAPFYPLPAGGPNIVGVVVSLVALTAITVFAAISARRRPYVLVGWLWYLGTLVPVVGFVQIGRQQMADRYTYLPLLGIYLAIAWLVPSLVPDAKVRRRLLPVAAAVVVLVYAALAFRQVSLWHDGVTLFEHAIKVTEDNGTTRSALGSALFRKDRFREALPHLQQAVKQDPNDAHAHYSLGRAWDAAGQPVAAFAEYQAAIKLDQAYPEAENEIGALLLAQGKPAEAASHFQRAIEIDPGYASGYGNLGFVCAQMGKPEEAIAWSEKALQLDPSLLQCHQTIARVLASQGRFDEALARLKYLLSVEPNNQDVKSLSDQIAALQAARARRADR